MAKPVMSEDLDIIGLCLRDIEQFNCYTNIEEQKHIASTYRGSGRTEDRNLLVGTGVMWAVKLARNYSRRYSLNRLLPDLIQEAMLGLIRAAETYDPSLGNFSTYATGWIREMMASFVDNQNLDVRLPANQTRRLKKYRKFANELCPKLGREPIDEEMVVAGYPRSDLKGLRHIGPSNPVVLSLDNPVETKKGDQFRLLDVLADPRQMEQILLNIEKSRAGEQIVRYVQTNFPARNAVVFIRYYGLNGDEPISMIQAADRLGLSRERIRQIVVKIRRDRHFRWYAAGIFYREGYLRKTSLEELRAKIGSAEPAQDPNLGLASSFAMRSAS